MDGGARYVTGVAAGTVDGAARCLAVLDALSGDAQTFGVARGGLLCSAVALSRASATASDAVTPTIMDFDAPHGVHFPNAMHLVSERERPCLHNKAVETWIHTAAAECYVDRFIAATATPPPGHPTITALVASGLQIVDDRLVPLRTRNHVCMVLAALSTAAAVGDERALRAARYQLARLRASAGHSDGEWHASLTDTQCDTEKAQLPPPPE